MNEAPVDLTVEIRFKEGRSAKYCQTDAERIQKTLRSLLSPRLLIDPQFVAASDCDARMVPCTEIDMILARTSAQSPPIFPLIFRANLLDIIEIPEDQPNDDYDAAEDHRNETATMSPRAFHVEIQTFGGWVSTLKALVILRKPARDQCGWLEQVLDLPVIPFRLGAGGFGLVNPSNVVSARILRAMRSPSPRCRSNRHDEFFRSSTDANQRWQPFNQEMNALSTWH